MHDAVESQVLPCDFNASLSRIWECYPQRPLTLILLQMYRNTNGSHIVIHIGGVYTTFCQKEGIPLQKYRDTFKSIGVRGRFYSPAEYMSSCRVFSTGSICRCYNSSDFCSLHTRQWKHYRVNSITFPVVCKS